jgi:hypothetical protein
MMDLWQVFAAGMNARRAREAQTRADDIAAEDRQYNREQASAQRDWQRQQYADKQAATQQELTDKRKKDDAARSQATADFQQTYARALAANPGVRAQLDAVKQRRVSAGEINDFAVPTQGQALPEGPNPDAGQIDTKALLAQSQAGGAKQRGTDGLSPAGKRLAERDGVWPGDVPNYPDLYDKANAEIQAEERAARKAGASSNSVVVGANGERGIGLAPPQQSKQQERVLDAQSGLAQLDIINRDIEAAGGAPGMAGAINSIKGSARSAADTLGVGDEGNADKVQARARAIASLGSLKNQVLHDLSGAAVSPTEMERLIESIPDAKRDSPSELQAKLGAWREKYKLAETQGTDALLKGIRVPGATKAVPKPTADRAAFWKQEAMKRGLGPDWASQQLEKEAANGSAP